MYLPIVLVAAMDPDHLGFIINHVFMPPELPQQADDSMKLADMNFALLNLVHETAAKYQRQLVGAYHQQWTSTVKMLSLMCDLQGSSPLSKSKLVDTIQLMVPGGTIFFHP